VRTQNAGFRVPIGDRFVLYPQTESVELLAHRGLPAVTLTIIPHVICPTGERMRVALGTCRQWWQWSTSPAPDHKKMYPFDGSLGFHTDSSQPRNRNEFCARFTSAAREPRSGQARPRFCLDLRIGPTPRYGL
jgi:hypothetical protein